MAETKKPQVLIVDPSEDSREVIQIALDRRGVSSMAAATPAAGLESAKALQPELIVWDVDSMADPASGPDDLVLTAKAQQSSLLFIGETPNCRSDQDAGDRIDKPYHFSALVNKIEELLARPKAPAASTNQPKGVVPENVLGPAAGGLRRAA